jgi:HSP20 family molecular chaperone IbpA
MGWLKRVFGSTDAVEDATRGYEFTEAAVSEQAESGPMPSVDFENDELVVRLPLRGVDRDTVEIEHEHGQVRVRASGGTPQNRLELNEVIKLDGPFDADAATTDFEDDALVLRVPKRSA